MQLAAQYLISMPKNEIDELSEQLFRQAKMQFGSAIKSRWFHDGDGCPGCGRKISEMNYKGKKALSLNAFIYREHGVFIAYLLCGKCAKHIFRESEKNPFAGQTALHSEIEKNLKQAFVKHLGH
jgi:hypothetical protein